MSANIARPRLLGWATAVAVVLACTLVVSAAWGMRVSPMVSELTMSGAGSSARIEVGNIGSAALPFETKITRLDYDANGEMVETPADEDFLVFPPQGLVPVGGRQVVRVQWVGAPDLDVSHAYYLWVRQLPVATDLTQPETGGAVSVSVLYTMKALLVVAPEGARPDVKLVSARPMMVTPPAPQIDPSLTNGEAPPAPPAEPGLEIVVENQGKRYALMSGASWVVEGTDKTGAAFQRTYTGDEISRTVGVGYLAPAGGRRTFNLPTGVELDPARPVRVTFAR